MQADVPAQVKPPELAIGIPERVRGWHGRYYETGLALEGLRFDTYILSRESRSFRVMSCRLGKLLFQRVTDGAPHVAIGRLLPGISGVICYQGLRKTHFCNGAAMRRDMPFLLREGTEFSLQARAAGEWILLTTMPLHLERGGAAEGRDLDGPTRGSTSSEAPLSSEQAVSDFSPLLASACSTLESAGPAGLDPDAARRLGENLLRQAVAASRQQDPGARQPGRRRLDREHLVSRIEEFFTAAAAGPVYDAMLCKVLGVSERTLRYIFAELYGAGPTHVLRCRRLCQVHRALLEAPPSTRITSVATRFGFRHPGQFAADYRGLFGERPLETIRGNDSRPSVPRIRSRQSPEIVTVPVPPDGPLGWP